MDKINPTMKEITFKTTPLHLFEETVPDVFMAASSCSGFATNHFWMVL